MASWTDKDFDHRCLSCGSDMAGVLWRLGSILCHDCRASGRSVDPGLLEEWADAQWRAARQAAHAGQRLTVL